MNPNPENMPFLNFKSIEDPYKVKNLAKEERQNFLQKLEQQNSNNIQENIKNLKIIFILSQTVDKVYFCKAK